MAGIDDLMNGFYTNDYSGKDIPKGYNELRVYAYEMRLELQKLINKKHIIKTGFKGKSGHSNRSYYIYYKK